MEKRGKILVVIVEDETIIARDIQSKLRRLGYDAPVMVSTGEEALEQAEKLRPDLVLMDIVLKGRVDGIEAAQIIQDQMDIPVVYLTAYADERTLARAKVTEPFGYMLKPFEERELHSNVQMALYKHNAERKYKDGVAQLLKSLEDAVNALASLVEMRDPYTAGHQRRVADLAVAIGIEMKLAHDDLRGIRLASLVHDIGKITVPAEILNKPGKISKAEFDIIKRHSQAGYDVLKDIAFPWPVARMVGEHHEKIDGSGYPQGLTNGNIHPHSKIIAVADVVEAMSSHRPYRPSLGVGAALAEIEEKRGTKFDPDVVDICLKVFRENKFSFSNGRGM
jgi:putative two-component system response regulator